MQVKLTAGFVLSAAVPGEGKDRVIYWDGKRPGFGLMITAMGRRSFVFQYRNGKGESKRASLSGTTKLADAHKWADIVQGDVAKGEDPVAKKRAERAQQSKRRTFRTIAEEYIKREGSRLRSIHQRVLVLKRLIYPAIGDKQIDKIKRKDVIKLLDEVEDKCAPSTADLVLMVVRRIMNWHAARDEDYASPIVRGMSRSNPGERARKRILSDEEVRAVWRTAEAIQEPPGLQMFGKLLQYLLLTGARRNEGARMGRQERVGADWIIPSARVKAKREFLLPLSRTAIGLLDALRVIGDGKTGPIFTTDGERPLAAFSQFKKAFDALCALEHWTIHDLRRTARSLMSRAGVPADHAERAIGHVIGGIRGIYDRYEFYNEKKQAFEALEGLLERILNPPEGEVVVPFRVASGA
jgi:integrase